MQILPRMLRDPGLFVVFNLLSKTQSAAATLLEEHELRQRASLKSRFLFLANPPLNASDVVAGGGPCKPEWEAQRVLRTAGMPVLDARALMLPYIAEEAAGRLPPDSDGAPIITKTEDHWGGPMQRAVLRHVLTRVAGARYVAGAVARPPAHLECGTEL